MICVAGCPNGTVIDNTLKTCVTNQISLSNGTTVNTTCPYPGQ
jgi:hypothetical protein